MASSILLRISKTLPKELKRNFGLTAPALQSDVIQQLFLEKLKEYKKLSQGGKLVDASPEIEKELKSEMHRIDTLFNVKGTNMSEFPKLSSSQPTYDPIDLNKE